MRVTFLTAVVVVLFAAGCGTSGPEPATPSVEAGAQAEELYGEWEGASTDPPAGWPCGSGRDVAGCPDAEPVGRITVDGQVVTVTSDTEVYGCGPTDGRERRPTGDLFEQLDGIDTAWVQVAGAGPTLRAVRVHIGICG